MNILSSLRTQLIKDERGIYLLDALQVSYHTPKSFFEGSQGIPLSNPATQVQKRYFHGG